MEIMKWARDIESLYEELIEKAKREKLSEVQDLREKQQDIMDAIYTRKQDVVNSALKRLSEDVYIGIENFRDSLNKTTKKIEKNYQSKKKRFDRNNYKQIRIRFLMPGNVIHVIGEEDTVILLSLLGIEGTVINQKNEFLKEFNKVIRNPSIGMVIIAVDLDSNLIDYLTEYKLNNKKPFIFSLPDIFNPNIEEDEMFIEEISKSMGKIIK